jgi:hypothetical protein
MRKKSKPRRHSKALTSAALMAKDIREIRREIKRLDDPVRYVVYQYPFRGLKTRFFLDVSEDTFRLSAWTQATLFKQKRIARLVAQDYSIQQQRRLHVARVTIKAGGKRGSRAKR